MTTGLLIHDLITMETCQKLASLTLMDSQMMSLCAREGVNMFFFYGYTQHCVVWVAAALNSRKSSMTINTMSAALFFFFFLLLLLPSLSAWPEHAQILTRGRGGQLRANALPARSIYHGHSQNGLSAIL